MKHSLKLNAALNVTKQLMNLIFPLISFPYSSRILNPDGIGKVNFALSVVSYFALIAGLGIGGYAQREAAKIREDKIALSQFSKEIILINFASTLVSYIFFFIAVFLVPTFENYRVLLYVCSSTILFSTFGVEWLYKAKEEYVYITVRGIVFQFVSLALLFFIVKKPEDYIRYAAINVIASVGSNLLNFINLRKIIVLKTNLKYQIKKHLKPIFILFASGVAVKLYNELDRTMLGFLSDDAQVGYYSAATKLSHLVINLIVAVTAVLSPRLSNYYEHERLKYMELLKKSGDVMFMLCIPFSAGLFAMAKPLTELMCGQNFEPSVIIMKVMSPVIIFISISTFYSSQIFLPCRKDKYTFFPVMVGAIANSIFNGFFIQKYQALGAGIATVIAEFSVAFMSVFLAHKITPQANLIWKNLWKYVVSSLIMAIAVHYVLISFSNNNIVTIFAAIFIGIATYFSCLILIIKIFKKFS